MTEKIIEIRTRMAENVRYLDYSDYERRLQMIEMRGRLLELRYNHNHDDRGRFCSGGGSGRMSSSSSGNSAKTLDNSGKSDIIKSNEMQRSKGRDRADIKPISDERFDQLTIEARKNGATILRGTEEVEEHLDKMQADASIIGDIIFFRKQVCVSEVLEETHHFMQNKSGMNDDKGEPLRTILNEIDAKNYLLDNTKKFKIPRSETELTKKQLESYENELKKYKR